MKSKTYHRPGILPSNTEHYRWLDIIKEQRDYLCHTWLTSPRTDEDLAFAIIFLLMADGGIAKDTLHLFASLTVDDIWHNHHVRLKHHPKDEGEHRSGLTLPITAFFILNTLRYRKANEPCDKPLLDVIVNEGYLDEKKLKELYQSFAKDFSIKCQKVSPSWSVVYSIAHLISWQAGLDPWVLTLQSSGTLPAAAMKGSNLLHTVENTKSSHIPPTPTKQRLLTNTSMHHVSGTELWQPEARDILRCVIDDLMQISDHHYLTDNQLAKANTAFDDALVKADAILPVTSALHMSLNWLRAKLNNKNGRLKASSMLTYLERVVFTCLLANSTYSEDMTSWDVEDLEVLIEERIEQEHLSGKSIQDILISFRELFTYGEQHGYIEAVDLSEYFDDWVTSPKRAYLIGISTFENTCRQILESDQADALMIVVAACLVFYGGLRPIELSRLTINEIIIAKEEVVIEVRYGKTDAARRRIVFSTLASPFACQLLRQYHQQRIAEFRYADLKPKAIGLFGPSRDANTYRSMSISQLISTTLRQYFGAGFVTYHLRHSAAAWLFLRWFALRHPAILDHVHDRDAAVFDPDHQQQLARYFTNNRADKIDPSSTTDLFILAKTFGHLSPATTFTYYIHSFSFVQDWIMQQQNKKLGQQVMSGKLIAQLIPKMKSRTTQAKLTSKRLCDLL